MTNSVCQGAVSSSLLLSVYIDDFGCKVDSFFYGVLGYASLVYSLSIVK